jgi:hypothetical protein
MLMTQTGTKQAELKGVDAKSQIIVLKNKLRVQKEQAAKKPKTSNSSILPMPTPIGQQTSFFGIDDYIDQDAWNNKNEIIVEIPMTVAMDPKKNKALGERK